MLYFHRRVGRSPQSWQCNVPWSGCRLCLGGSQASCQSRGNYFELPCECPPAQTQMTFGTKSWEWCGMRRCAFGVFWHAVTLPGGVHQLRLGRVEARWRYNATGTNDQVGHVKPCKSLNLHVILTHPGGFSIMKWWLCHVNLSFCRHAFWQNSYELDAENLGTRLKVLEIQQIRRFLRGVGNSIGTLLVKSVVSRQRM